MKPVWEESWSAEPWVVPEGKAQVVRLQPGANLVITGAERCRLAAAAPELVRVLLAVERCEVCGSCAYCKQDPSDYGHAKDCKLHAALVRAGVRKETAG